MTVKDRVAIVTGSGSGIGEGIAKMLAANGAKVIVNDLDQAKIERVVSEIKEQGGTAIGMRANLSLPEEAEKLIDDTVEQLGRLDILVNNAGTSTTKPLIESTVEDFDRVMGVNLKGVFLTSRAAARHMMEQNYGRIIHISSRAWLGDVNLSIYSASKGGVVSISRSLARELAKHQITSNTICPGPIETPLFLRNELPEEVKQERIRSTLGGSMGKPEDIANGVLFFAADESSYITGQTLFICGGKSLFASLSV